jgi:hypothetical protein
MHQAIAIPQVNCHHPVFKVLRQLHVIIDIIILAGLSHTWIYVENADNIPTVHQSSRINLL